MMKFFYRLLIGPILCTNLMAAVVIKQEISNVNKSILNQEVEIIQKEIKSAIELRNLPFYLSESSKTPQITYRELMLPDSEAHRFIHQISNKSNNPFEKAEVRPIIVQGPDNNRIILTILGDGYTLSEKDKFFDDVQRIVDDLFVEVTFKSYLPLFNIYAVFVPSKESGITDTSYKETVFDLYRSPRGSKRGVMPGNRSNIERAIKMVDAYTDYPIIIANDDFYGGLGGRYAITTRSLDSGSMVLRHELGHNFSNVGEEYDGGQVYQGANFSSSKSTSWKHWINDGNSFEAFDSDMLFGAYVWQPLTKTFVQNFNFDGTDSLFALKISSVGWDTENAVEVLLDGKTLQLEGVYTQDRSFFTTTPMKLSAGKHQLVIRSNGNNPQHVLAFARGYAYPLNYTFDSEKVGAFNVFNESGRRVGYRPSENICLMRDMRSKVFCSVDQENIWLRFLSRVSLIDTLTKSQNTLSVQTLPIPSKDLDIRWFKKVQRAEQELTEFRGQSTIDLSKLSGEIRVQVQYIGHEVRKASEHTTDSKTIEL